ncbi:MAG: IPT/TIG domain-containing protein [Actinomycetes bacterium]
MQRGRLLTKAATTVAATTCVIMLAPAAAQADIYWAQGINAGGSGKSQLGQATLAGSVIKTNLGLGTGLYDDVAVGSDAIYWANYADHKIGRSKLDGTSVEGSFISVGGQPSGGSPTSVAADRSHIYWTNYSTSAIGRANLNGTNVNDTFIDTSVEMRGVVVTGQYVYWAEPDFNRIGRANLDGSVRNSTFITGASKPMGVAVDAGHLYWTNSTSSAIGRANLDGTGANQSFVSGIPGVPVDVEVDGSHIYWSNTTTSFIGRANVTGIGVREDTFLAATVPGGGIAVVPVPTAAGVGTSGGPVAGGTSVAINGTGLYRTNSVKFGGVEATSFTIVSDTQIVAITPAHSSGPVDVSVTTPGGTANKASAFTFASPAQLPVAQLPLNGCATPPQKLPRAGIRTLTGPGCVTNAGQQVALSVKSSRKNSKKKRYFKVYKAKNGATVVRTYGKRVRLTITWSDPAVGNYLPYSLVVKYNV